MEKRRVYIKRIIDGDTFQIATGEKVRIANINAPEKFENGYKKAKNYLCKILPVGSFATLNILAYDKYGRIIAKVSNWYSDIGKKLKRFFQRL